LCVILHGDVAHLGLLAVRVNILQSLDSFVQPAVNDDVSLQQLRNVSFTTTTTC